MKILIKNLDYSTLYWSLSEFINQMFPQKYYLEIFHLINSFFGLMIFVGVYQLQKNFIINLLQKFHQFFLFLFPFFWSFSY